MTKEEAMKYVRGWGPEKLAENIAFYNNVIDYLTQKHYPELRKHGYSAAGVGNVLLWNRDNELKQAKGPEPGPDEPKWLISAKTAYWILGIIASIVAIITAVKR
jgi:hypothetical protein